MPVFNDNDEMKRKYKPHKAPESGPHEKMEKKTFYKGKLD
jgi:hypothetical protein